LEEVLEVFSRENTFSHRQIWLINSIKNQVLACHPPECDIRSQHISCFTPIVISPEKCPGRAGNCLAIESPKQFARANGFHSPKVTPPVGFGPR